MYVLTLKQPWASLIFARIGHDVEYAKQIETRSWNTKYRGNLLIHSSQKFDKMDKRLCGEKPFNHFIQNPNDNVMECPLGCIIGKVVLYDVVRTESVANNIDWIEKAFGDYSPGRFAWRLKGQVAMCEPLPMKGNRLIWRTPDSAEGEILNRLGMMKEEYEL